MKKILSSLLVMTLLLVGTETFAQMAIEKGTKFLNAGIGVGGYGYFNGSGVAIGASFDYGVYDNITVGAIGSYRSYGNSVSSFDIGARGSYHFNDLLNIANDKVDLYAGLGLSFYNLSYGSGIYGNLGNYTTVYLPFHLGGRYLFSDNVGAFAELGSSLATLKIGVTFKF